MVKRWAFLAVAFLVVAVIMMVIVSHPTLAGCIDEGAPCDYDGDENDDDGHCENGVCVPNYWPGGEISLELIADPPTITTNTDFLLIARISGVVGGGPIITYKRGGTLIGEATCGTTMDGCEAILTWQESTADTYTYFASHDIYGNDVTVEVTPTPITCPGGTVCFDSYPRCLGNDLLTCGINDCEESHTCEYGCSGVPGQAECNSAPSCTETCGLDGWCNSECSTAIACSEDDDCSLTICSTPRLCMSTPDIAHPPSIDVSNSYYCDAQDLLCYECPTNAYFNDYDCQCISGYVWNDNTDSCEISCDHECYDPTRVGECKRGRPDCSSGSPKCIYPAPDEFSEVCDGLDNDCDNLVDEGLEDVWFLDNDGDGDGNPDVSACSSGGINGNSVENDLDCNDNNQNENSTAIEIDAYCSDGLDNDCDGGVDGEDGGCGVVSCGSGVCESNTTIEHVWIKVEKTCQEEQFSRTTYYSNPACIEEICTHLQVQEEDVSNNRFQNTAENEPCEESTTGFCKEGVCLDTCNPYGDTPGCQETVLANTEEKNNGCPVSSNGKTQICYSCRKGFFWGAGECQKETHKITNVNSMQVDRDVTFILNPVTEEFNGDPITNVKYVYSGKIINAETTEPLTIKSDKIGTYEIVISAYKTTLGNTKLASKTIEISLACPANTACCPTGRTSYAKPGTSCSHNGYAGTCNKLGSCVLQCTNPEFENTAQTCSDGRDNDCDGVYDCVINNNGNKEQGCHAYCEMYCEEGETSCGEDCVNIKDDHDNCGRCGTGCDSDQVCEQGECVRYINCYVACDEDNDCGAGICLRPGKCDAYCENVPVIELSEELKQELFTSVAKQKPYQIKKSIIDDKLILEIVNLLGVPISNFTITISIPKRAAQKATEISSDYPFSIVHDDPVIRTHFETLIGTQTLTYYFQKNIDKELEEYFTIYTGNGPIMFSEEYVLDKDELSITSAFREDIEGTTVTLKLTPGKTLTGVRVPLEVPKCLASSVSEMNLKQDNYVIVNDDPLMVWTFDTLVSEQEIEFRVPRIVDEECKKQLRAFGLAEGKRIPLSPWLPLAIIPVIGVILIFFQRFHEGGPQKHLSKKEFFIIARDKGEEEHEIERAWYEYKRRF